MVPSMSHLIAGQSGVRVALLEPQDDHCDWLEEAGDAQKNDELESSKVCS